MNLSEHAYWIKWLLQACKNEGLYDAICSRKGNFTENENNQHYVWEYGCEVDHLRSTYRWHISERMVIPFLTERQNLLFSLFILNFNLFFIEFG